MNSLKYQVVYRNGDRIAVPIAIFSRDNIGHFLFEYVENPRYEFPGFEILKKNFSSDILWEQIAFRVPNNIRNQKPGIPLEDLLVFTEGKLVTDHFEFL